MNSRFPTNVHIGPQCSSAHLGHIGKQFEVHMDNFVWKMMMGGQPTPMKTGLKALCATFPESHFICGCVWCASVRQMHTENWAKLISASILRQSKSIYFKPVSWMLPF